MKVGEVRERSEQTNGKVSKVRWALGPDADRSRPAERLATGTWDESVNEVCLWRRSQGSDDHFVSLPPLQIPSDVQDFAFATSSKLLVATGDGDLMAVDCGTDALQTAHVWRAVHRLPGSAPSAINAISLSGSEVISGGEDGQMVRVDISRPDSRSVVASHLSTIQSIAHIAHNQVVSGHLTGQMQVWDGREGSGGHSVASLCTAVTALSSHPAQPQLMAFGTQTGSIGFVDVRQTTRVLTDPLPIAAGPVWEIKFHPIYPSNCFTCADDGILLHCDATDLQRRSLGRGDGRENVWLCGGSLADHLQLTNLLPSQSLPINSFDLTADTVVVGTDSETLRFIDNVFLQ